MAFPVANAPANAAYTKPQGKKPFKEPIKNNDEKLRVRNNSASSFLTFLLTGFSQLSCSNFALYFLGNSTTIKISTPTEIEK